MSLRLIEALQNAKKLLEVLGHGKGMSVHDDLNQAICHLQTRHPHVVYDLLESGPITDTTDVKLFDLQSSFGKLKGDKVN